MDDLTDEQKKAREDFAAAAQERINELLAKGFSLEEIREIMRREIDDIYAEKDREENTVN
jgi:hypothetical protein